MVRIDQFVVKNSRELDLVVSKIRAQSSNRENSNVTSRVAEILDEVKKSGDEGLIRLVKKFESETIASAKDLRVSRSEIEQAYSNVTQEQIFTLKILKAQIAKIASSQMKRFGIMKSRSPLGFSVLERYVPFGRVGGYVPGGLASYPSTVLMICATAKEAGVKDIVLATPPRKNGKIPEPILVAADICGVKEIIKAGGAQAIGALAFGTESIEPAGIIVGPGNQYVTEAKRQVSSSGRVLIDSLAGPTELLIIADKTADPILVAEDLISQAEHGNRTICGVVSDSPLLIKKVVPRLKDISARPRLSQIQESILFTAVVQNKTSLVEFSEKFASEHLEVMIANPTETVAGLTSSGLVLMGDYTPCSSTDYIAGTNHILPTGGTATMFPGLGVEKFLKRVTVVTGSSKSLKRSSGYISTLANMESLPNHAAAVYVRFRKRPVN